MHDFSSSQYVELQKSTISFYHGAQDTANHYSILLGLHKVLVVGEERTGNVPARSD